MELTTILFELITSFAFAGGLGYINYFILHTMGTINLANESNEEKYFSLIICSIINIVMFIGINNLLLYMINEYLNWKWGKDVVFILALFITLAVTVISSFTLFKSTINYLYKHINEYRKSNNLAETDNRSVRQTIFDKNKVLYTYVYHLETHALLCHGCMGAQLENSDKDFEFEIYPFEKAEKWSYDVALMRAQKNDDASIYINIDKKIKIIVIPEPND